MIKLLKGVKNIRVLYIGSTTPGDSDLVTGHMVTDIWWHGHLVTQTSGDEDGWLRWQLVTEHLVTENHKSGGRGEYGTTATRELKTFIYPNSRNCLHNDSFKLLTQSPTCKIEKKKNLAIQLKLDFLTLKDTINEFDHKYFTKFTYQIMYYSF